MQSSQKRIALASFALGGGLLLAATDSASALITRNSNVTAGAPRRG